MESDDEAALIGRIAVRHNFITLEQLEEATRERGRLGKKLGVIMLEKGMIDEFALGKILALQQRHQRNLDKRREERTTKKRERKRVPTPRDWVYVPPGEPLPGVPRRRRNRPDAPAQRDRPAPGRVERPTPPSTPAAKSSDSKPPEGSGERHLEGAEARPASPRAREPSTVEALEVDLTPDQPFDDEELTVPDPIARGSLTASPRDTLPEELPEPESAQRPRDTEPTETGSWGPARELDTQAPSSQELEPHPTGPQGPPSRRVEQLHTIFRHAAEAQASDVHVSPGNAVRMRLFGRLVPLTDAPLAPEATEAVLRDVLTDSQRQRLDAAGEVDFPYSLPDVGRFRANVYRQLAGLTGVFHYVPGQPPTLSQLGLPTELAKLTNFSQGLILVTGPAGSGKTSTLAALVKILNDERRDHILTIEDPVEYLHVSNRCIVNQRQVGRHTTSFARALRGALREDPDIICIGELRDLETISLALSAAETGHLVLATLHTGSSIGTINRIVGSFPPTQQSQVRAMMSESLRAIISQRLLPTVDHEAVVPALEILYVNRAVSSLIRDNRTFQIRSVLQTGRNHGMQLLDAALRDLVGAGRISKEVALQHCEDPKALEAR